MVHMTEMRALPERGLEHPGQFQVMSPIDYRVATNDNELFVAVTAQMNAYIGNPGILEQNVVINTDASVHKIKYA